jgi:hypothetical protein
MTPMLLEIMTLAHLSRPTSAERCRLLSMLETFACQCDANAHEEYESIEVETYTI